MTRFLRKVTQSNWDFDSRPEWMADGDWHGDILRDLGTAESQLSVYEVPEKSDERRIAVAIASTRDRLTALDYLVVDDESFDNMDMPMEKSEGSTGDDYVNGLHYNITKLSARKLGELATAMTVAVDTDDFTRISKVEVESTMIANIKAGHLRIERISEKLQETLKPKI